LNYTRELAVFLAGEDISVFQSASADLGRVGGPTLSFQTIFGYQQQRRSRATPRI